MGRIKPRSIKRLGKKLVEKYPELFSTNFEENKRVLERIAVFPGKAFRNKLAGYITRLKKRSGAEEKVVVAM